MLRHLVGNHADALDLLQESLMIALREVSSLRDAAALEGWLKGLTVKTAWGFLRKHRRRRKLAEWGLTELPPALQPPVEAVAAVRTLYRLLDELAAEERVAFSLRHFDGFTVGEAAGISGMSLSTFKRRLARAEKLVYQQATQRGELAEWLQEEGDACRVEKQA
jgi:RNA polymerase sigma-70 factor (ECF subfamily)